MTLTPDPRDAAPPPSSGPRRPARWIFLGFLSVAAFFLFGEHRAHVLGALPYLLLAACPLMHLLHHRHHGHRPPPDDDAPPSSSASPHRH